MASGRNVTGVLLLAGLVSGCGLLGGGGGVGPEFVRRELGCEYRESLERSRERRASLGDPDCLFTPRVGWNACVLLSHNGPPSRARREREGSEEELLYWWYEDAPGEGLAVLAKIGCAGGCDRNESPWRVAFVRW